MPFRRPPAWLQDVLLAAFVTVMQVQGTIVRNAGEQTTLDAAGYVLLVAGGVVVAGRRYRPGAVFAVTALASALYYGLGYPDGPGWLGLFVATYTFTALGDGRRALVAAGAGIAVLTVVWLVAAADIEPRAAIGWVYFRIGASVLSATLGESVRTRRFIAAEALARAELAERTREARVSEERLRIAREVHDTVAHAIAIINVQAGVTAHVLDKRPDHAREALLTIESTSSRALREMRAILGVLRDDHDGRVPHPGLGEIAELAEKAREAGLDVELRASPAPPVPGAVGSAVYRILQESLTNVVRHAGSTRVTADVEYGEDTVTVRVRDEGRRDGRPSAPEDGPGHGIQGMRERCRLLGGDLLAGPVDGGGFAVTATLPLARS